MYTVQRRWVQLNKETNYIQRINDVLAVVMVSIVLSFSAIPGAQVMPLLLFSAVTFISAYLYNQKLVLFHFWGFAFYGFCILSNLWLYSSSGISALSTTMIKMMFYLLFLSLYIRGEREIRIVLKSFIIGAVLLFIRLVMSTPISEWGTSRLGGDAGINENFVGMVFTYAAIVCLFYARKKNLYILGFLVFGIVSLFSGSRKAFVLLIGAIVMLLVNKIRKPSNVLYIIPFGCAIFLLVYYSINNPQLYHILGRRMEGLINMFTGKGKVDNSTIVRFDLISIGIEQFQEKILIGHGIHSFKNMNKYGYYAHNNYVELLVNYGLIGAILYYLMPVSILIKTCITWLTKTRNVILAMVFLVFVFITDYGMVSYYSPTTLILLVVSYRMLVIYLNEDTTNQGGLI